MDAFMTSICSVLLAQMPDAALGGADVPSSVEVQSVWDFVRKGGLMMIPIGLCSLIALGVVVERLITLRRGNVIPGAFLPGLNRVLKTSGADKAQAVAYCRKNRSPVANVFAAGIKKLDGSSESVSRRIQEAGEREVLKLRRFLRVLAVIASITPLMGLLGTIFGMIRAFQTVAASGEALGKTEMLAGGIYEAMITTAAGLLVAIPVLICYHWISAKIDKLVMDMDQMTQDFIEEFVERGLSGDAMERSPAAVGQADGQARGTLAAPTVQVAPS